MRHSKSTSRNPSIADWTDRLAGKDNLQVFGAALEAFAQQKVGNRGVAVIGLLGQNDLPGFVLRTAQSTLRWDRRPSLWSHAFLIAAPVDDPRDPKTLAATPVWEVALHARDGELALPERNGVTEGTLGAYKDPELDANVAFLAVKMSDAEARSVVERARQPNLDRIRFDFLEMLAAWQGFFWARGRAPNPLEQSVPLFSSAYLDMAFEAISLDLTPGASDRNSAPEHLWNSAVWWHEAFQEMGHPISGVYVLRDKRCYLQDAGPTELPDHLGSFGLPAAPTAKK